MLENKTFIALCERISKTANSADLFAISLEIQTAITEKKLTDEKDVVILMLSLQLQTLIFQIEELRSEKAPVPVYIIMADATQDYEQMQLEEFYGKELENFRKGCVFTMDSLVAKIGK